MSVGRSPETDELIQVNIGDLQKLLAVDADRVRGIARDVLIRQGVERAEVSIIVVDDAAIRIINAHHLAHDWATDVVSFPFGSPGDQDFGGELIISAETAVREAELRQLSAHDEFALYLVHGLLHLCGFDDRDEADVLTMRRREGELLAELGIENPFQPGRVGSGLG